MNDKKFEKQVNRDIDKAKIDLAALRDDGITGLNRIFDQLTDDTIENGRWCSKDGK